MKRLTFLCTAAILLLSLSLPALALNSLTNGSFELPAQADPATVTTTPPRNVVFSNYTEADATAWAWTKWGNFSDYVRNGMSYINATKSENQKDGKQWVSVTNGISTGERHGGIMQEVAVQPGRIFRFTGWYRTKNDADAAGTVTKSQIWLFATLPTFVGGVTTGELITSGGGVVAQAAVDITGKPGWAQYSNVPSLGLYVPGSKLWVVTRFYVPSITSGGGMHMDGFSLTSVVPEPGTLVGLIGLSGMLGFVLRRRR